MSIDFQPYVGPRPFTREEHAVFFGRDREANDLLSLVVAESVVLLYAQSGAGKTSLFNAKLIPLLEDKGFEILPLARVHGLIPKDIEPEEITNLYVFNTLMSWAKSDDNPKRFLRTSLADFLRELKHPIGQTGRCTPRILIFDQFEELFSSYQGRWKDREKFFAQLADALDEDHHLRVVFAIREDYLAQLDPYASLLPEKLRTRFRLERLRAKVACLAVEGPLRNTKYSFEVGVASNLVQQLLNIHVESVSKESIKIEGQFVEPVQLQVVCQSLWQNLPSDVTVITSEHLQEFGDVEEAIRNFYNKALDIVAKEADFEKGDILKWVNDKLITPAGTRGTVFRGDENTEGMPNPVMEMLEAQHIIRAEIRARGRWYELTHDRLIEPGRTSWYQHQLEDKQAKASRRFHRLLAALGVMLFVAIIVTVFAFKEAKNLKTVENRLRGAVGDPDRKDTNIESILDKVVNAAEAKGRAEFESVQLKEQLTKAIERIRKIEAEGNRPDAEKALANARESGDMNYLLEILIKDRDEKQQERSLRNREIAAVAYLRGDIKISMEVIDEILKESPDDLFALNYRGKIMALQGRLKEAESDYNRVLNLAIETEDNQTQAVVLSDLGNVYKTRGDLVKAEEMYLKSLEIDQKLGRQEGIATQYSNLGNLYYTRGDLVKAEEMYLRSLEIAEKHGAFQEMANAYGNIGLTYSIRGDLDKAEEMYLRSLEIDQKLGRQEGIAIQYSNLGNLYYTRGDFNKAEEMYQRSLEIEERLGRLEGIAIQYSNLGLISQKRGDNNKARQYWENAVELYKKIGLSQMVKNLQELIDGIEN